MASPCRADPPEDEKLVAQHVPAALQAVPDPPKIEYDFIEQPSQDFFCPVTLELLTEPQQTTCCGNHLSQEAAQRLQRDGKPCPKCREPQLATMPDKFYKRKVNELKVRCPHKKSGCEWVGGVNEVKQHSQSCPKSPWQCQYCLFASTYDIGVSEHVPKCTQYPVVCPNCCEVGTVPRCVVETHLMVCPLEPVACEYAEVGCDMKVPRRDLACHMEEGQQQHLLSATLLNLRLTRENTEERNRLLRMIQEKDGESKQLKLSLEAEATDLHKQIEHKDKEIAKKAQSIAESHRQLQQKETEYRREMAAKDQHIKERKEKIKGHENMIGVLQKQLKESSETVTELRKQMAAKDQHFKEKGEKIKEKDKTIAQRDEKIKGHENMIVELQKQRSVKDQCIKERDKRIKEKDETIADLQKQLKGNGELVTELGKQMAVKDQCIKERDEKIKGKDETIAKKDDGLQKQLKQMQDRLEAKVTNLQQQVVKYEEDTQKHLTQQDTHVECVSLHFRHLQQGFTLHEFTLTEFSKWQAKGGNGVWYSEPFYSHPGGYKFQLRIDTNGAGSARGVYVSMWFKLSEGDHDDKLKWPVTITAHVQLLNQLGDHGHHEKTSTYSWRNAGFGGYIREFTKLSELGLNADKNTQYLKNDRLHFRIYCKAQPDA